jgi:hypothetical protein
MDNSPELLGAANFCIAAPCRVMHTEKLPQQQKSPVSTTGPMSDWGTLARQARQVLT